MNLSRRAADWLAAMFGRREGIALPNEPASPSAHAQGAGVRPTVPGALPVQRRRGELDRAAEALEGLRRQAHTDAVTGLPNRRHFLGRLSATLAEAGSAANALLIVRVLQLEALNLRLGHDATDHVLAAVADVLAAYPERVPGAFAGRLNGSDFALVLPVGGVAEETAQTLLRALRAAPAGSAAGAEMVVGGIEGQLAASAGAALAAADEALAAAEAAGPFAVEIRPVPRRGEAAPIGERAWRQRIEDALGDGRAALAEFAVKDAAGRLLYLECPLRVQLESGGAYESAARWIAMASRGRLLPMVDLAALELALVAIGHDGRPRCVHVAAASLAAAGFVGEVQRRLEAAPRAAALLGIEVAEGASFERSLPRLREASAAWRRHGVKLALVHASASMQSLPRLAGLGLDHIVIGARFVRGAAADEAVRGFAAGLVKLAHALPCRVIAAGVDDARDLEALWALGFDGATGPAVTS